LDSFRRFLPSAGPKETAASTVYHSVFSLPLSLSSVYNLRVSVVWCSGCFGDGMQVHVDSTAAEVVRIEDSNARHRSLLNSLSLSLSLSLSPSSSPFLSVFLYVAIRDVTFVVPRAKPCYIPDVIGKW